MVDVPSPEVAFWEEGGVLPLELAEAPGGELVRGGGGGMNSSKEDDTGGGGELADVDEEGGEPVSDGGEGEEFAGGGNGDKLTGGGEGD